MRQRASTAPGIQWVRPANGLNPKEADWVFQRKQVVLDALDGYLSRLHLDSFDLRNYLERLHNHDYSYVPTLGMAISGGGYESAYTGTGAMRALDDRLAAANDQRTGGLLQSLTYLSGLSGGSWPVLSFAARNFPMANDIVRLWKPEISRLQGVNESTTSAATPQSIFQDLVAKYEAAFNISTADFLGCGYAYEFFPGEHGGVNATFSDVVHLGKFRNHQMPFPILQALEIVDTDPTFFGLQAPHANATTVRSLRQERHDKYATNPMLVRYNSFRVWCLDWEKCVHSNEMVGHEPIRRSTGQPSFLC